MRTLRTLRDARPVGAGHRAIAALLWMTPACSAVSNLDRFEVSEGGDAGGAEPADGGGSGPGTTPDTGTGGDVDASVAVGGDDLLVVLRDVRDFEDDYLELRVLDGDAVRHAVVALLPPQIYRPASDDIAVLLPGALRDLGTAFVDVYADVGEGGAPPDGQYTPPAAGSMGDPAWREPVVDGRADLAPRTSYDSLVEPVVSGGPFSITITGLPDYHRGALFELRVVDASATSRRTVGHLRLGRTPPGDSETAFMASIQGVIEPDVDYEVEFYFDNDGDDAYDPPTTDHAWRLSGRGTASGLHVDFEHGGEFTDVGF